jgi:hypothetical protein
MAKFEKMAGGEWNLNKNKSCLCFCSFNKTVNRNVNVILESLSDVDYTTG